MEKHSRKSKRIKMSAAFAILVLGKRRVSFGSRGGKGGVPSPHREAAQACGSTG